MTGTGNGELAISADGSRILLGKLVSTDPFGVQRWHPYLNVNDSNSTIDLAPSTTTGVIFSGMSADGSTVYFVTKDKLAGGDTDNSADLYRADVSGGQRHPDPGLDRERRRQHRRLQPGRKLRKLHLEQPGRHRVLRRPRLRRRRRGLRQRRRVLPLSREARRPGDPEPAEPVRLRARAAAALRRHDRGELAGDPQRPDERRRPHLRRPADDARRHGRRLRLEAAADRIPERRPLGGLPLRLRGRRARLRLVRADPGDRDRRTRRSPKAGSTSATTVGCSSARPSSSSSATPTASATPTSGRTGRIELISTGSDPADSGLLSVSADGVNAYFFTRQILVPEDENATAMKIYDAREDGGLRDVPGTRPMPGLGRVPRRRQSGGAAGIGRHAEGRPAAT